MAKKATPKKPAVEDTPDVSTLPPPGDALAEAKPAPEPEPVAEPEPEQAAEPEPEVQVEQPEPAAPEGDAPILADEPPQPAPAPMPEPTPIPTSSGAHLPPVQADGRDVVAALIAEQQEKKKLQERLAHQEILKNTVPGIGKGDTIPERTYWFKRGRVVVLHGGTNSYVDPRTQVHVPGQPPLYAKCDANGMWRTTSAYEAYLMENHAAFKQGKVVNYADVQRQQLAAIEATAEALRRQQAGLPPEPQAAQPPDMEYRGVDPAALLARAGKEHGDFTLPPLQGPAAYGGEPEILPRRVVTSLDLPGSHQP